MTATYPQLASPIRDSQAINSLPRTPENQAHMGGLSPMRRADRMKCEICGEGPSQGVTVYRQNPLGEVGRWRCEDHNSADVDRGVQELVDTIVQRGQP